MHGREEDVHDEVAGMEVLVPEDRHDRDLEKNWFQNRFGAFFFMAYLALSSDKLRGRQAPVFGDCRTKRQWLPKT